MQKSRTLETDYYDRSDSKYWASSGSATRGTPFYENLLTSMPVNYESGRGKAATLAVSPSGTGSENIESSTRGRRYFNDCTHLKYIAFNYPFHPIINYPVGSNSFYYNYYYRLGAIGTFSSVALNTMIKWADVEDIQRRAWWSMQPRFESEISMLNFIYELKDFFHLAKLIATFKWADAAGKLRKARSIIKAMEQQKKLLQAGKLSAAMTKVISEAWLFNAFALQPLLKDVGTILDMIEATVDEAQAKFSAQSEFFQKSHYSEDINTRVITGTYASGSQGYIFTGSVRTDRFTATLQYAYDYKLREGWDKVKRWWGYDLTASSIWEAIPFSFLVDYFWKVGDAIHNMQLDKNVQTHVYQYCESILTTLSYGRHIDTSKSVLSSLYMPARYKAMTRDKPLAQLIPTAGYEGSHYRRRVTSPNRGSALPRFALPTDTQKWNMLALVRGFFK